MEHSKFFEQNQTALLITGLIVAVTALVYRVAIYPFVFLERLGIPHPKYKLLVGNFPEVKQKGGSVKLAMECMEKLGKVFGFYLGVKPVVVVADPELLETVFVKEFSNFHNRGVLVSPRPPMNLNLVVAHYRDWRRIRPTLSPTFSSGKIRQTIPIVAHSADTLASILSKLTKSGETFDISKLYARLTIEIILSVAFGLQTEFQLKGDKKVSSEAAKFFTRRPNLLLVEMLPLPRLIKDHLQRSMISPDPTFFLNLLKPVLAERRKKRSDSIDFLELLLSENKADGTSKLSDDEIHASAITFLLAGHETTSNTLSYTTYLLALNPDSQEKLFEEVKNFPMDKEDTDIYEQLQKFDYLDAVIKESLRMYPPVWQTNRKAENDIVLGKYKVPAGTNVTIPIFAIHHYEGFWKDPDTFDPERFSPERKKDIIPFTFLPFGHGPRNCIGMRFALIEAKLTLVTLIKKFRFIKTEETEPHPLQLVHGITMSPANGIKIKIAER